MTDLPRTPEGRLIRRVREQAIPKLTIRAAAARIGMSPEQWGYAERGYVPRRGDTPERDFHPPAATLASMASGLGISPERLESEGERPDAAEILREILRGEPTPTAVPAAVPGLQADEAVIARVANADPEDRDVLRGILRIPDAARRHSLIEAWLADMPGLDDSPSALSDRRGRAG